MWKIAVRRGYSGKGDLQIWGALFIGYNVGAMAVTFNYPLFIAQGGMEFWLLNGALFAAAYTGYRRESVIGASRL